MPLGGLEHSDSTTAAQQEALHALDQGDVPALKAVLQTHGAAVLRARIECWMSIIDEVLTVAFSEENHAYLRTLLDAGLDPNFVTDDEGRTLLMRAAISDPVTCRMLLDYGADPSLQDGNGHTALFYAADLIQAFFDEEGAIAVAKMLREAGASIDAVDREGRRPLSYAQKSAATLELDPGKSDRLLAAFR